MVCEHCLSESPLFCRSNLCCRVRLFFREPRIDVRRAWLSYWKRTLSEAKADQTEQTIKRLWPYRTGDWQFFLQQGENK